MEIAVSISNNRFFIRKSKGYNRILSDFKAFTLTSSVGLEIYPNDVMFFCHRMLNGTDCNGYSIVVNTYYLSLIHI